MARSAASPGRKRRLYQRLLRRAARRSRGVSRVGARARRRADRRFERRRIGAANQRPTRGRSFRSATEPSCCWRCAALTPSSGLQSARRRSCSIAFAPTSTSRATNTVKRSFRSEASCWPTAAESRSRRTRPERARRRRSPASSMRIAVTANGPGEVAGWLRPLLRALYRRQPDLEALVFLVPDDYATGLRSADRARRVSGGARLQPKRVFKVRVWRAPGESAAARGSRAVYSAATSCMPRAFTRG